MIYFKGTLITCAGRNSKKQGDIMKKITTALIVLMTVLALGIGATFVFAAPSTVYVSSSGNDANDGSSAANAVKTLDRAFALMPDGGKIVFTGTSYTIDKNYSTPKSEGKYTLTSEMKDTKGNAGVVSYSGVLSLNSDFLIENIRFKGSSTPIFACNGNNVTFGNNIKNDSDSYIVGGANLTGEDNAEKGNLTEDYTIEIKSGRWVSFFGGNRRATGSSPCSTISGDINIIIDGATFKTTETDLAKNQNSISGMNSTSGDLNLTVKSGEIWGGLFAVGRLGTGGKSPSYSGNINIKLLGGTFENLSGNSKGNGIFNVCQDSNGKYNGDFHLEVSDAAKVSFKSIGSSGVTGISTLNVPAALVSKCTGFVRDVYVSGAGKDTNGGTSKDDAYATLAKAAEAVKDNGGRIIVCGNTEVTGDVVLKAASKDTVITSVYKGEDYKNTAKLTVSGTLAVSSNLCFENITLAGSGTVFANGKTVTFAESVSGDGNLNVSASAPSGETSNGGQVILLGGSYNTASAGSVGGKGAASVSGTLVSVEGAAVKVLCVSGGNDVSGSAVASILKGEITEGIYGIYGTGEAKLTGSAVVEISGGKIGGKIAAVSDGITGTAAGKFELSLLGGELSIDKISGAGFTTSIGKAGDEFLSKLEGFGSTAKETVLFVKLEGAGKKDGSSPENALASIDAAIKLFGEGNGTIVVCGPIGVNEYREPEHKGEIKITSRYAGVDYRRTADAKFNLGNKYILSGPVTFDDIVISTDGSNRFLFGNGHPLTLGEGVSCVIDNANGGTYPYIFGGMNDKNGTINGASVTVNGGTWYRIIGGNRNSGTFLLGDISVTINGGNITGFVAGTGYGTVSGNVKLEINGGTVRHGVYGIYCDSTNNTSAEGNIDIYLNGGTVKGKVNASRSDTACSYNGTYTCHINGANLDSVTDIKGAASIRGNSESKRTYGVGVNYTDAPTGTVEAQNPLCSGADPWVIYHDGFYYMAVARGSSVCVSKAATVADLGDAEPVPVWTANEESGLSSIWSPELHYFSADEFGAEYEGWYLYIACIPYGADEDDQSNTRRCYVTKAVGSDPQGSYMAPDTKKLNHATKMLLYKDDTNWCIGPSVFRIEGKTYLTWTGHQKETGKTRQNLNIAEMISPYEIKLDTAAVFCWPTEAWEKHGATYDASNPKNLPEVVEGATALYGPNGTVYCVYSVSGYWTDYYALASLKFKGGNPCDINNWEKSAAPIFVANRIDVFGPGHAAFVQSADGLTNYLVYHGYKASGRVGGRYVHVEEYTFDENGILHLGSGIAATKDQMLTVAKNPLPLSAKMSAFGKSGEKPEQGNTDPADTTADTTPETAPVIVPGETEKNNTLVIVLISAAAVLAAGAAGFVILSKKKKASSAKESNKDEK